MFGAVVMAMMGMTMKKQSIQRRGTCAVTTLVGLVLASVPARAQVDLSGSWAARNHEDSQLRFQGPLAVDYTGLPLNESGRARALSYSESQLSEPERVCLFYAPFYMMIGPFGLRIWSESDPHTGTVISWQIGGWEDRAPNTIWMDGRPHPPKNAPHEKGGFATGVWEGNVLTTYTTHFKAGYIRRNGAPTSDEATLTEHFLRHGDVLTVTTLLDDPVYLSEPMYWSRTFQLEATPIPAMGPPCIEGDEGTKEGVVPHYLPGKNPWVDEMTTKFHIPQEAVMGGAETMYPEFRKKMKDKYVQPDPCKRDCLGNQGGAAALAVQ
jgi:hypothetical protein